jgi:L-aminopeptidase/D-esterase-like protein
LEEQGIGFEFGNARVPLVPAAVIFDLSIGDAKARPGAEHGRKASEVATTHVDEGSVGAGTGATVGKRAGIEHAMKGGLGTASARVPNTDVIVGAIVVCNAGGDILDDDGTMIAGAPAGMPSVWETLRGQSTVLGCVVTNAVLTKGQAMHVARMGAAGISRSCRPAHSFYDGDVVFCGATGEVEIEPTLVGSLAADVVADALRRGVRRAKGLAGVPGLAD